MPYFDPQPTPAELTAWLFPNGQPHKVPRWPRPQTNRVNARFRLPHTAPVDGWTGSRFLFRFQRDNPPVGGGGGPRIDRWGWADVDTHPFADLRADLPPDIDTLNLTFEINSADLLDTQPGPGVFVSFSVNIPGFGGAEGFYEWGLLGPRPWRFNVQFVTYPFNFFFEQLNAPWPWFINNFRLFGVTDCYTFPRIP